MAINKKQLNQQLRQLEEYITDLLDSGKILKQNSNEGIKLNI